MSTASRAQRVKAHAKREVAVGTKVWCLDDRPGFIAITQGTVVEWHGAGNSRSMALVQVSEKTYVAVEYEDIYWTRAEARKALREINERLARIAKNLEAEMEGPLA